MSRDYDDRERYGYRSGRRRGNRSSGRYDPDENWIGQQKGRVNERRKRERIYKIKTIFILSAVLIVLITVTVILFKFKTGTMFLNDTWYPVYDFPEATDDSTPGLEYHIKDVLTAYSDFAPGFNLNIKPERIPAEGNEQRYIAIHYLGVNGENNVLETDGEGTHFYIYWDGTIYQTAGLDAVTWHVGTAGQYTQLHPDAGNNNTIGIEMCAKCDGDPKNDRDPNWYFTEETQESCVLLTAYLMKIMNIRDENVIRHGDIVDKYCPAPYFNNNNYKESWTWDEFKSKLRTVYRETDVTFPVQWESQ